MIYHRPGLHQAELTGYLEMEPIAVGRVIDRLLTAGCVERRADPNDRRVWRLHTTQQVAGVVADMEAVGRQFWLDATIDIAASEMRQALAVMTRIKGNLLAAEQMEKALPEDSSARSLSGPARSG